MTRPIPTRAQRRRAKPSPEVVEVGGGSTYSSLLRLDAQLAAMPGGRSLSPFWRAALRDWYRHPTARTFAACAGRGSAKSFALYRVALAETLFGSFEVPRGERHWACIASISVAEATKGLAILDSWLRDLGVPHTTTPSDGTITLRDAPRGIRVTAASVAGTSGWRAFFTGADEAGKWPTEGAARVDAREVLASMRAMTATHRNARHMVVSSPFLDSGPFYEVIDAGTTAHAFVVPPTPTWVAMPGVTEEDTRALEPHDRVWRREYAAQFGAAWEDGYFPGDLIDRCVDAEARSGWAPVPGVEYVVAIDPAFSSGGDAFVVVVAHHDEGGLVVVDLVHVIEPEPGEDLEPTLAFEAVAEVAREYRVDAVLSDQHSFVSLRSIARDAGVYLVEDPWTKSSKGPSFEFVRALMRDRKLRLPADDGLRRELGGIGIRLLPSGHERIAARYGMSDDRVAAMVMAVCHASERAPRVESPRRADERSAYTLTGHGSRWSHFWQRGFG